MTDSLRVFFEVIRMSPKNALDIFKYVILPPELQLFVFISLRVTKLSAKLQADNPRPKRLQQTEQRSSLPFKVSSSYNQPFNSIYSSQVACEYGGGKQICWRHSQLERLFCHIFRAFRKSYKPNNLPIYQKKALLDYNMGRVDNPPHFCSNVWESFFSICRNFSRPEI